MPDDFEQLADEIAALAKTGAADVRAILVLHMPSLAKWAAEADAAEAAGNAALAKKKRSSIRHVKAAVVLAVAERGVNVTNKAERVILGLIDKALGAVG